LSESRRLENTTKSFVSILIDEYVKEKLNNTLLLNLPTYIPTQLNYDKCHLWYLKYLKKIKLDTYHNLSG